jgi:hypothetical protein
MLLHHNAQPLHLTQNLFAGFFTCLPITPCLTHPHGQSIDTSDKNLWFADALSQPVSPYHNDAFDQCAHAIAD